MRPTSDNESSLIIANVVPERNTYYSKLAVINSKFIIFIFIENFTRTADQSF